MWIFLHLGKLLYKGTCIQLHYCRPRKRGRLAEEYMALFNISVGHHVNICILKNHCLTKLLLLACLCRNFLSSQISVIGLGWLSLCSEASSLLLPDVQLITHTQSLCVTCLKFDYKREKKKNPLFKQPSLVSDIWSSLLWYCYLRVFCYDLNKRWGEKNPLIEDISAQKQKWTINQQWVNLPHDWILSLLKCQSAIFHPLQCLQHLITNIFHWMVQVVSAPLLGEQFRADLAELIDFFMNSEEEQVL